MASPQTTNGFTKIANEIIEQLAKTELKGSEFAIILTILRKTYGFNKKEDKISVSQLQELIKLSRRTIIYNLQNLEAKNILVIKRERMGSRNEVNLIRFNKDYDMWVVQNSAPQVEKNRLLAKSSSAKLRNDKKGSAKLGKKVVQNYEENVQSFAPTKETIQKKEQKKDTAEPSSANVVRVIDAFRDTNPSYEKWFSNTTQRSAIQRMLNIHGEGKLIRVILLLPKIRGTPYFPTITTPLQLEDKWASLETAFLRYKNEKTTNKAKIAF